MERIPLTRRTGVLSLVGLAFFTAAYLLLFANAGMTTVEGPFFTLIVILAVIALLGHLVLSLEILRYGAANSGQWLGLILRFCLLAIWLALHLVFLRKDPSETDFRTILIDLDLGLLTTLIMTTLTAQFVLPVEKPAERMAAVRRLLGHALGERGPVMYIHEGQAIKAHGESVRTGPGVFLVDHASAVVFRTDTAFTRAAGPGVIFTRPGERLAEALDLRRQERRLVLRQAPGQNEEKEEVQAERTQAITRDGIQVGADVSVEFMLDPGHEAEPREGRNPEKPPYEFHRQAVERAVYGHVFSEFEDIPWSELPLRMALDLWREEVKSWNLDDLLERGGDQSPLQRMQLAILTKMRTSDEIDGSENSVQTSREASILQSRGIRVLDVRLRNLQVPPEIQAERQLQWRERWSGSVQESLREASEQIDQHRRMGEHEANGYISEKLNHTLSEALNRGQNPSRRETLNLILADAIRMLNDDRLNPEAKTLAGRLQSLLEGMSGMDADCRETEL